MKEYPTILALNWEINNHVKELREILIALLVYQAFTRNLLYLALKQRPVASSSNIVSNFLFEQQLESSSVIIVNYQATGRRCLLHCRLQDTVSSSANIPSIYEKLVVPGFETETSCKLFQQSYHLLIGTIFRL